MKTVTRFISVIAVALLAAVLAFGQASSAKKQYTFHGKVVSVDKSSHSLRVAGEKVEGWMGAMTMDYKVDNPSIVDTAKPGDRITATVYDGDYSLHDVKVVPGGASGSKK
jgi:Cu/Ag efflux protein CusF